jgi:AcrR family transcriptional regulator
MADKDTPTEPTEPTPGADVLAQRPGRARPMRADGRRNRLRVIEVAFDVFAAEGLSVPVHEIARRAGVGTGTVSRHFPTKELLFEAVFMSRVERLGDIGQALLASGDPGEAFFAYFAAIVAEGAANKGLAEALAGAGYDLGAAFSHSQHDIMGVMGQLLNRAQRAGAVRDDVETDDVKALITGCVAREASAQDRMISIARTGLEAPRSP